MPEEPTYLEAGTRLIVRKDRQIHGAAIGVSPKDNDGYVWEMVNTNLLLLVLGPALVEDLGTNHKHTWELFTLYGPIKKALYHEILHPHTYRYTLRDGQRFLFCIGANGVDFSVLLQDRPAHFWEEGHDSEHWDKLFLEHEA